MVNQEWYETTAKILWFVTPTARSLHYVWLKPDDLVSLSETGSVKVSGRFAYIKLWCGHRTSQVSIPDRLQQTEMPRCRRCCIQFHIPYGYGSPIRDPECLRILGLGELQSEGESQPGEVS